MSSPRALGRAGAATCAMAVIVMLVAGVIGPSAISAEAGPPGPDRSLDLGPSQGLVTSLLGLALVGAGIGLLLQLLALRRGWRPQLRIHAVGGAVGAVLLALVPPMGSTDIGIYAVYGRMVHLGLNPYTTDVLSLVTRGDPIALAYAGPWLFVPSVYGPVAIAEQAAAALVGDSSARMIVWLLQGAAAAVFLLTAWVLDRAARPGGAAARARVAILWTTNPILLYQLVNAGHVDGLAALLGVCALVLVARRPALAAVAAALAVGVKVTYAWYAVALLWALRGHRRSLTRLVVAGAVTGLLVFAPVLPEVLGPLRDASRLAASISIWHPVEKVLDPVLPSSATAILVSLGSLALMAAVGWRLRDWWPGEAVEPTRQALRAAALLGAAWLLTAPYALPWYDVIAWAPLMLLPTTSLDLVLLARMTVASVVYLPGAFPSAGATHVVMGPARGVVAPLVSWVLVAVVWFVLPRRPWLSPVAPPGASPPR
jgi:alpha-1,6-mannosyltransferase